MSAIQSVAWWSRHFTMAKFNAVMFRNSGNIPAARREAKIAREDWRHLQESIKYAESKIQNQTMITVHYKDVGRDKKTWSKQFNRVSDLAIALEARLTANLMSSEVDAELSDNALAGVITVGGWRQVGTFTIEKL